MMRSRVPVGCLVFLLAASWGLAQQPPKAPTRLSVLGVDVELGMKWVDVLAGFTEVSPPLNVYPSKGKDSLIVSRKDGDGVGSLRFKDGRVSSISNGVYSASVDETPGAVRAFEALFQLLSKIQRQDGYALASVNLTTVTDQPDLGMRWAINLQFLGGKNVEFSMMKVDNRLNNNVKGVFISEEISK
jgi:hypothetical protein